jgi:chemotaxis protein CheD
MSDIKEYTIFPGQFIITTVPALISTVLGSCVAVCLWDKVNHVSAMNHYLLPGGQNDNPNDPNQGLPATRTLIRALINRNVKIENVEAKVFGGCNSLYRDSDLFRVGERNVEIAHQVLREFNIPLRAHHTGGCNGRRIVLDTRTGKVKMKLLLQSLGQINEDINKGFGY